MFLFIQREVAAAFSDLMRLRDCSLSDSWKFSIKPLCENFERKIASEKKSPRRDSNHGLLVDENFTKRVFFHCTSQPQHYGLYCRYKFQHTKIEKKPLTFGHLQKVRLMAWGLFVLNMLQYETVHKLKYFLTPLPSVTLKCSFYPCLHT